MINTAIQINKDAIWYHYRTQNNNVYPLEVGLTACHIEDLIYDPKTVRDLCKTGCKNYGLAGGVPLEHQRC